MAMEAGIAIRFRPPEFFLVSLPYSSDDVRLMRTVAGARYSRDSREWHIPDSEKNREHLRSLFGGRLLIDPCDKLLMRFKDEMVQRNLSRRTIGNYLSAAASFCAWYGSVVEDADADAVARYARMLSQERKYSPRTINLVIAALDFFFSKVLGKQDMVSGVSRMKLGRALPKIYSQEEVSRILSALSNTKHRVMLVLAYSCGLRVAELVRLRWRDIDTDRNLIWVRRGKGAKDRSVMLSRTVLKALKGFNSSAPGSAYIFAGQDAGSHITARSAEKIYTQACIKAGVEKRGGIHTLRHSFATHLHEKGYDIRIIQELLGHASSKTTEIYTHVSNRTISKVVSPIEDIKFGI